MTLNVLRLIRITILIAYETPQEKPQETKIIYFFLKHVHKFTSSENFFRNFSELFNTIFSHIDKNKKMQY